jgi:two-component system sensor histidine kinase BaeS
MGRVIGFAVVALTLLATLATLLVWAIGSVLGSSASSVIGGMVVLLAVVLVARSLVRGLRGSALPIADMMEAAGRVEAGDYDARVREDGPRDLRRLARAFNAMSQRLAADEEERRKLLADVSHELRTPLSVIQGNVEGILDGLYPADRAHLEPILEETQLLERLVEDLRTLSLSESGALRLHREPTDLGALLADTVAGFGAKADAASVSLQVSTADGMPAFDLDQARMHQVIGNLLANALRFTPAGGQVQLQAVPSEEGGAEITVSDTGPGIAADDLPRIFERFFHTADSGGSGLGLPIARSLVEAHGGSIEAHSPLGGGTTMRIRLPATGDRDADA